MKLNHLAAIPLTPMSIVVFAACEPSANAVGTPGQIWHELVQCARTHGSPNLPTRPSTARVATFPRRHTTPSDATRQACQSIYNASRPPPLHGLAPDIAMEIKFAAVSADPRLSDWPDPDANGDFVCHPTCRPPTRVDRCGNGSKPDGMPAAPSTRPEASASAWVSRASPLQRRSDVRAPLACGLRQAARRRAVPTTTALVTRTDITSRQQLLGTLSYVRLHRDQPGGPGIFTALPQRAPSSLAAGSLPLNGRPVVLLYGDPCGGSSRSASRRLGHRRAAGELAALGFATGLRFTTHFDWITAIAARRCRPPGRGANRRRQPRRRR